MSGKNKNYNSIIFLTTLSVYLGLVLVGGSPQVLAYAATTKNFDIRHEIEFKDDLDNKPDNENPAELKTKAAEQNKRFISHYAHLFSSTLQRHYLPDSGSYNISSGLQAGIGHPILPALDDNLAGFPNFKSDKQGITGKFSLRSNNDNINSFQTFSGYKTSLDFCRSGSKNEPAKVVSENTKVIFENNQVFIITNLPRASIDSLIK